MLHFIDSTRSQLRLRSSTGSGQAEGLVRGVMGNVMGDVRWSSPNGSSARGSAQDRGPSRPGSSGVRRKLDDYFSRARSRWVGWGVGGGKGRVSGGGRALCMLYVGDAKGGLWWGR